MGNAEMAFTASSASCRLLTRVKGVSFNSSAFAVEIAGARRPIACARFRAPDIVKNSRINRVDNQFDYGDADASDERAARAVDGAHPAGRRHFPRRAPGDSQ